MGERRWNEEEMGGIQGQARVAGWDRRMRRGDGVRERVGYKDGGQEDGVQMRRGGGGGGGQREGEVKGRGGGGGGGGRGRWRGGGRGEVEGWGEGEGGKWEMEEKRPEMKNTVSCQSRYQTLSSNRGEGKAW